MRLSDAIRMWKEQGMSEKKALRTAKAKVLAAGQKWSPVKMQLFVNTWNEEKEEVGIKPEKKEKVKRSKKEPPKPLRDKAEINIVDNEANQAFSVLLGFGVATIAWSKGIDVSNAVPFIKKNSSLLENFLDQTGMNTEDYLVIKNNILKGKKFDSKNSSLLNEFGLSIKMVLPEFSERAYRILPAKITYLKNIISYLRSKEPTDKMYANIVNKVTEVRIPEITALFKHVIDEKIADVDLKDVKSKFKRFKELNGGFGGNEAYIIPTSKMKEAIENSPKKYSEHNALKKELDTIYKNMVRSIVDSSGQNTVDVDDVIRKLKSLGMPYHRIPINFKGQIDAKGKLYTNEGYLLRDQPAGIVTMGKYIGDGGKYDPETGVGSYCTYRKPGGGYANCYTLRHAQGFREEHKEEIIKQFSENVESGRQKWIHLIKSGISKEPSKNYLCALVTELMCQFAPRPGSAAKTNNKKYEETTGMTYLKKKNVTIKGDVIEFNYMDKNGAQSHTLEPVDTFTLSVSEAKLLCKAIKRQYAQVEDEEDYFWSDARGVNIKYSELTQFINSVLPGFKPHKFRNVKATNIAKKELDACPLDTDDATPKEVNDYYMKVMTDIGKELGHHSKDKPSPSMAISNYVAKSVSNEFFDRYNVSPTQKVAIHLNKAEASTTIKIKIGRRKS